MTGLVTVPGFAARVVQWQATHGRNSLPWQNTRDPYRVWLSEIMLQQTQVSTVLDYYPRFLIRFPDVLALAEGHIDEVLALWSGWSLGTLFSRGEQYSDSETINLAVLISRQRAARTDLVGDRRGECRHCLDVRSGRGHRRLAARHADRLDGAARRRRELDTAPVDGAETAERRASAR